jgi:L-histidine N-alpha-methyltransferase
MATLALGGQRERGFSPWGIPSQPRNIADKERTQEGNQVSSTTASLPAEALESVAQAARHGLTATPVTLPPWLFYDAAGSQLFEQITALPEYYLTRTESALFTTHAAQIFHALASTSTGNGSQNGHHPLTLAELGAGTAAKTGILLRALTRLQPRVLYQPIDISPTALDHARATIERTLPAVDVRPQVANYATHPFTLHRPPQARILALYIGSSIGNFSPAEARAILRNLRSQLAPGDALLLGTDLAPSPAKPLATLLAAYNDAAGVTAAFNLNILARLNRELAADFDLAAFRHRALWNPTHSRIEMHLESLRPQTVHLPANSAGPALTLHLSASETIHTENSYKFTPTAIGALLHDSAFTPAHRFTDPAHLFAVTLAIVA